MISSSNPGVLVNAIQDSPRSRLGIAVVAAVVVAAAAAIVVASR
jgi:hypothetical protein